MKFEDWKIMVRESLSLNYLREKGLMIKDKLEKDFERLYFIPDFDTFSRNGEPFQQSVLFTNKELKTFSFNYTEDGKLFSIDFWHPKAKNPKPSITVYYHRGSLEDLYLVVPEIAKNPKVSIDIKSLLSMKKSEMSLTEAEGEDIDITIKTPKDQLDADPEVKKIEKKTQEYDFADPDTIFDDLKTYVNLVIKGSQPSLLITGSPGVGKTHVVTELLRDSRKEFIHVKGKSTAMGMYSTLYENNGKIVVFDDCDSVFASDDTVNILKGALDSYGERNISWISSRPMKTSAGEKIPNSFTFTGSVIFISNLPQRKIDDAIKSRSFVIEVALTPEDMLKKMRKELPNVLPSVPKYLKQTALSFIERISNKTDKLELNMRTLIKAIKIIEEVDDLSVAERLIMQQCSYK